VDRRRFLLASLAGALAAPRAAAAQQPSKIARIAYFVAIIPLVELAGPEPHHPRLREFIKELRARGWIEGQNLIIERRTAEGRPELYEPILRELVGLNCDVIVTVNTPMTEVARNVTRAIPIVGADLGDPVLSGLVNNHARPGGNLTAVMGQSPDLDRKRFELLRQALPKATRLVALSVPPTFNAAPYRKAQDAAAAELGFKLTRVELTADNLTSSFALIERQRPDAVFVGSTSIAFAKRDLIVSFATRTRLPLMATDSRLTEAGGFMSYSVNGPVLDRTVADYVDRILRGAKPGDLPVQLPTKIDLVINLKTAKALGLTIPQSLLLRADRVID
jgi:putative ABC transport system substrate-binding protein